ncbi:434_t:CDS:2 [Diversispora eburnea]|uniref:BRO domain-containing protein 1 n=1 Tax=Diversispora eburnea TaxID=1213867 RepID=A0A9N9A7A4_9GLOM|nr:434_t:CDS:2 [Diversispora eburnea]
MNQSPTIHVSLKRTEEVDWANPLKRYIQTAYQEDPEKYAEEANTIHRLRQDMRGAGKDIIGRDLLYRYYGQLELLDLRFPVDENHIKVSFTWYDAFTNKTTSQFSLAYEKASTIFNLASVLSAIAASQNRSEPECLKRAYNFFQASAGMYTYINDNFLHAPSTDLSRDTVKLLSQLMLTQAQECFLEQSLGAKKKPGLVAKLAAQTGWSYGNIVENMADLISRSIFDRSWLTVCQIKHKYFASIAQYQKSLACELEGKYGESVGRLIVSESLAKDANKLSNSFSFSPTSVQTLPPDAATSLQNLSKLNLALITEKKNSATRDNELIYHEAVPQENVISPIDKLNIVNPMSIQDLYNQNEIQKIIGVDIFQRLIPLSVHESASLYSEEKAKIVRSETERCDLSNGELEAALEYMKLPGILFKFLNGNDTNELATSNSEVQQWAGLINEKEEKETIKDLLMTLNSLKASSNEKLNKISYSLEIEKQEYEAMKVKYGDLWTQPSSSSLTTVFRQDLLNHMDKLEQADNSNRDILQRYNQVTDGIIKLCDDSTVDNFKELNLNASESLLDIDISQEKNISTKVNKVEECLDNLNKVRKERMDTLNDLKDKTHQDDISHLLILNKKTQNIEPQLFATELEKFSPYRNRITSSIHHQQALLQELTTLYKNLMESDEARLLLGQWDQSERKRKDVSERLNQAKSSYLSVKDGMRNGIQFYVDLNDLIENLSKTVQQFIKSRLQERNELAHSIQLQERNELAHSIQLQERNELAHSIQHQEKPPSNISTSNSSFVASSNASSTPVHTSSLSYGSSSAPPKPSAPPPTSPTLYYPPPPLQRPLSFSSQSSLTYNLPVSSSQAPPLPPLPTEYSQKNSSYQTEIQRSFQSTSQPQPQTQAPSLSHTSSYNNQYRPHLQNTQLQQQSPQPMQPSQQQQPPQPMQPSQQQPPLQPMQPSQQQPQYQPMQPLRQQLQHQLMQPSKQQLQHQPMQPSQKQVQHQPMQPSQQQVQHQPMQPSQQQVQHQPMQPSQQQVQLQPMQPSQQQVQHQPMQSHQQPQQSYSNLYGPPPVPPQLLSQLQSSSSSGYAPLPPGPQQYQVPLARPIQQQQQHQQYPTSTPVIHPQQQQYIVQRPQYVQPSQVVSSQQQPNPYNSNPIPSQVSVQQGGYHNQPVPSQLGYYQPKGKDQASI